MITTNEVQTYTPGVYWFIGQRGAIPPMDEIMDKIPRLGEKTIIVFNGSRNIVASKEAKAIKDTIFRQLKTNKSDFYLLYNLVIIKCEGLDVGDVNNLLQEKV